MHVLFFKQAAAFKLKSLVNFKRPAFIGLNKILRSSDCWILRSGIRRPGKQLYLRPYVKITRKISSMLVKDGVRLILSQL